MDIKVKRMSTLEKALHINLDEGIYGAIAEIGAGQEVARNFFLAGGAAGTVAKSMSAYDMQVSDAIYGQEKDKRYVSQTRVEKMIDREYGLVIGRLQHVRSNNTKYFAFADTVVAKGYKSERDCHGWMGIKFQTTPLSDPCSIVLHVRMKDNSNVEQQQALGILGMNLIFAAFYYADKPEMIIESLLDNLSSARIEIDMIKFEGVHFKKVDNRLMALHLVRSGLTHSVFFTSKGEPIQAYDLLYRKNLLVLRGSFRPLTKVHIDIYKCAKEKYLQQNKIKESELLFLTELSMSHLMAFGDLDKTDFLGRVDMLCAMGFDVQISDFARFHRLKTYLSQFTKENIGLVFGIKNISETFSIEFHKDLNGGILEAMTELFSGNSQLFVYPKLLKDGIIRIVEEMAFEKDVEYLFKHFLSNNQILSLDTYNKELLGVFTRDIRKELQNGEESWRKKVPLKAGKIIEKNKLFGLSVKPKNHL